jgi:hypothetical protein
MGLADYLASLGYEENANAEFEDPSGRSLAQPKEEHVIYYDESFSTMRPISELEPCIRRDGP